MIPLTDESYAAAIPRWCAYQTLEQHRWMFGCWSLADYVERGEAKPEDTCKGCELYRSVPNATPEHP